MRKPFWKSFFCTLYESFIKFLNNLRSPHQWGRGPMGDPESYLSFGKRPKIHL